MKHVLLLMLALIMLAMPAHAEETMTLGEWNEQWAKSPNNRFALFNHCRPIGFVAIGEAEFAEDLVRRRLKAAYPAIPGRC